MMYRFSTLSSQWLNPDPQAAKARATKTNSRGITKVVRDRKSAQAVLIIWYLETQQRHRVLRKSSYCPKSRCKIN